MSDNEVSPPRHGQELGKKERARLFQHGIHEEGVFYARLNFFLVFESVLLGAVVTAFSSKNPPPQNISIPICILGFVVSVAWWFTQVNKFILLRTLEDRLEEALDEFRETLQIADQRGIFYRWSASSFLAYWFPLLFIISWICLGCISGSGSRIVMMLAQLNPADWIGIAQLIAIVVSVVLVMRQLKQSARTQSLKAYLDQRHEVFRLNELVLNNEDLRATVDMTREQLLVYMLIGWCEVIFVQKKYASISGEIWQSQDALVTRIFAFPFVRARWADIKHEYMKSFRNFIDKKLEKMPVKAGT